MVPFTIVCNFNIYQKTSITSIQFIKVTQETKFVLILISIEAFTLEI